MSAIGTPPKADSDSGARPFATVNPYTGETVREFPFLETEQIPSVVERADKAFHAWRQHPVAERAQVVRRAGDLMLERKEQLAALLTQEVGKLSRQSEWEVGLAASILQYYAERGPDFLRPEPLQVDVGEAQVVNAPLGVLLGVEPWNFPLYQVVRFAAPNLVVGNTILLKHAETCPQSALALEQLFIDAGAPEGVYTNVFLRIPDVARVIEHPAVQGASLTGSERAGSSVGEIAGRNLKKCVLELGGSDPFIVLDAADMDRTVAAAAAGRLANTGQSCVASKRFIVMADVYDEFVSGLARTFARYKQETPPIRPPRWAQCRPSRPPRTSSTRCAMLWTRAPRPSPAAGGPNAGGPLSTRPYLPMSALGCAPIPRNSSARWRLSTVSPMTTRLSSSRTRQASGSEGLCSAATCSARGPSPTGSKAAWCGLINPRPPRPTCHSAA